MRVAVVAAVLLGSAPVVAQAETGRPVTDDARLAALVARCVPAVERAAGRRFRTPPRASLASATDLVHVLRRELAPATEAFHRGQPRARIERALRLRADVFASAMLGKYGFEQREVLLVPGAVPWQLTAVGADPVHGDAVLQLVLVHELVHALQDQELDLGARTRQHLADDALEGWLLRIEGHAQFCTERAAAELGLAAALPAMRAMFTGTTAALPEWTDLAMRRVRGRQHLVYVEAAAWFARQHAAGGDEALWRILGDPAPTTAAILHDGEVPPREYLERAFDEVDARLAGAGFVVGRGDLSELQLRIECLPRGPAIAPALAALRGTAQWAGFGATPAVWRVVYALRFADAAAARSFAELAEAAAMDELRDRSGLEVTSGDGPDVPAARSRRITQRPGDGTRFGVARGDLLWVRRGRHVLQFALLNAPLADAVLAGVAADVLDRLDGD